MLVVGGSLGAPVVTQSVTHANHVPGGDDEGSLDVRSRTSSHIRRRCQRKIGGRDLYLAGVYNARANRKGQSKEPAHVVRNACHWFEGGGVWKNFRGSADRWHRFQRYQVWEEGKTINKGDERGHLTCLSARLVRRDPCRGQTAVYRLSWGRTA